MSSSSNSDHERRHLVSTSAAARHPYTPAAATSPTTTAMTSPAQTRREENSCCQCLTSYVPIEPLLFGYNFARVLVMVLTGFYFFDQASKMYGDPSTDSLHPCGKNGSSGTGHDNARAAELQKEYLQLTMIAAVSDFITAVVPTIFIGPATDTLGRRIGFVLPLLGTIARAIVFLLVLGTGASYYFVYVGTVLEGLGGGFGSFLMTSFSSVADITTPGRSRALRICIVEFIQVVATSSAQFIAGQWRVQSYTQPVMLAAALGVLTLIYALWFWPETLGRGAPRNPSSERSQQAARRRSGIGIGDCDERSPLLPTVDNARNTSAQVCVPAPHCQHGYSTEQGHSRVLTPGGSQARKGICGINGDSHSYGSNSLTASGESSCRAAITGSLSRNTSVQQPLVSAAHRGPASSDYAACCSRALNNVKRSWSVYFRSDATSHPARRQVLALCFFSFVLTVAVNFSKPGVETAFRMGQLCWNAVKESEFDAGWLIAHWLCILVLLHVLQHRLHVGNVYLALIGAVSAFCAPFIFSFATLPDISEKLANILVFVSAGSGTLARILIPMQRAMSSSVVSLDEQGALFASYACVELSGAAIFDFAATQVYKATVHIWKGIVFIIMSSFFIVVIIFLIIVSVQFRRHRQNREDEREAEISQYHSFSDSPDSE